MDLGHWKLEVKSYLGNLNDKLKTTVDPKYYGFYVWDSKIVYNPDILFIGINPGKGNAVADFSIKTKEESRISYLDYFDEEYNYPLAKETITYLEPLFNSQEDLKEFLENNVAKTNLFYIETDKADDIKATISQLGKDVWDEYYQKSCYFTIELIKILKPKIVIFEGKFAYDSIIGDCFSQKNTWTDDIGYYVSEKENVVYLGFSRTFSHIKNKEAITKLLSPILKFKIETNQQKITNFNALKLKAHEDEDWELAAYYRSKEKELLDLINK